MFRQVQCILKLDCAKAAFVAGARCRAFRHYSWVGCFATALNCYMAIPLLPTMSFRSLRGSRSCSFCSSSSSSSCGWTDRDSGERGDGGAEAPGTVFSPSTWEVVHLKARKMKLLGRLKIREDWNDWSWEWFFFKTWPTWKLCFVRWCNRQCSWTIYSSDCTLNFCAAKMLPCILQIISEAHQHLERGCMLRHFFEIRMT